MCVQATRRRTRQSHAYMVARREPAGLSRRGGARRSGRGSIGQREVVCALLEADDALLDVLRVRVHGRGHDLGEVVREEVGGVEARIARPVSPALPVFGATGKKAEAPGTAAPNATKRLYNQRHHLVTFRMPYKLWPAIFSG